MKWAALGAVAALTASVRAVDATLVTFELSGGGGTGLGGLGLASSAMSMVDFGDARAARHGSGATCCVSRSPASLALRGFGVVQIGSGACAFADRPEPGGGPWCAGEGGAELLDAPREPAFGAWDVLRGAPTVAGAWSGGGNPLK